MNIAQRVTLLCGALLVSGSVAFAAAPVTSVPASTSSTQVESAQKEKPKTPAELKKEQKKLLIKAQYDKIIAVLQARLDWEKNIGIRLVSRIQKMQAQNLDVSAAETKLLEAQNLWANTGVDVQALGAKIDETVDTKDVKTAKKEVAKLVSDIRTSIKSVHAAFVETITLLKPGTASTTSATTTTAQ